MGRDATKALGNPWYEARKNAAKYDERLLSREGAAEMLGMSVSSVADAELGLTKCMPVDKAVLMADLYKAPHLLNHYCLNECPIGCRHCISEEVSDIDRVTVKLLRNLKVDDLEDMKEKLLDIAEEAVHAFYALWDCIKQVQNDLEILAGDEMVVDAIYAVNDVKRKKCSLTTEE